MRDEELLRLILQQDRLLVEQGKEPKTRHLMIAINIMRDLGYDDYVIAGRSPPHPVFRRIMNIINKLFDRKDVAMGGHIGIYFFSDLFYKISIPRVYGNVSLNPVDFVEMPGLRKEIMLRSERQYDDFIDQFSDAWDMEGVDMLREPFSNHELGCRFLKNARLQMHAAAAIVTGGYDYRGAVQSSILASELALKAMIACSNLNENQIRKKYVHDLGRIVDDMRCVELYAGIDLTRVRELVSAMPNYVQNRYISEQPTRREVGRVVVSAQFVVAEMARRCSGRSFKSSIAPRVA